MNSKDLVKLLRSGGWIEVRSKGSHHIFEHPSKAGHISVPHPKKDLGMGLVKKIRNAAGV